MSYDVGTGPTAIQSWPDRKFPKGTLYQFDLTRPSKNSEYAWIDIKSVWSVS